MTRVEKQTGFTIVELLIVIVVIGILAAITIVAFNGVSNRAKVSAMQADLNNSAKSLDAYRLTTSTNEQYPADLAAANLKTSNGTTYQYSVDNTVNPVQYCLTAINGNVDYYIATGGRPTEGTCYENYGLVGWWQLNGNANDSSGTGANGTVTGATLTTGANGAANSAYNFAATADNISLPSNPALNNPAFTYTAWVKPTSITQPMTVVGSGYGSVQFRIDAGKPTLLATGVQQYAASTGTIAANTWSYIGVTFNTNGAFTYYINGVAAGSGSTSRAFTFTSNSIGRTAAGVESFVGAIDGVRMYNRALTGTEMTALFASAPL